MQNIEKMYCHALVSSSLLSRRFYREILPHNTFKEIYFKVQNKEFQKLFPRIAWKNIYENLSRIDVENEYISLQESFLDILLPNEIPADLKNIQDPPFFLYILGDKKLLKKKKLASVVGSRKMNDYSKQSTRDIVKILVSAGFTVVSGLARGVDYQSHITCLEQNESTFAILGEGILANNSYSRKQLYTRIIENQGLVISEYPPKFIGTVYTFPERNRIIAGLSSLVIVIQAGMKSGSLITARFSLEQGKDIFVVPGRIYDEEFLGSNRLIEQGAYIISDVEQFATLLGGSLSQNTPLFNNEYKKYIWNVLKQKPCLDEVLEFTNLSLSVVRDILLVWEMEGFVENVGGRWGRRS